MKKIFSILLAVVFFLSSTGFTISSHKCGGRIHKQHINFTAEDLSCGMEDEESKSCGTNSIEDDCCQNEFQTFKVTDQFQVSNGGDVDAYFFIGYVYAAIQLLIIESTDYSECKNYKPPLPDKDIPVLIQSFLI